MKESLRFGGSSSMVQHTIHLSALDFTICSCRALKSVRGDRGGPIQILFSKFTGQCIRCGLLDSHEYFGAFQRTLISRARDSFKYFDQFPISPIHMAISVSYGIKRLLLIIYNKHHKDRVLCTDTDPTQVK